MQTQRGEKKWKHTQKRWAGESEKDFRERRSNQRERSFTSLLKSQDVAVAYPIVAAHRPPIDSRSWRGGERGVWYSLGCTEGAACPQRILQVGTR